MQRVTFGKFLERTSMYERMPLSIQAGLRRGVWLSEVLLCACTILYQLLPPGEYARTAFFFLWKNDWLAGLWDFTADHRQLLIRACAIVFVLTLGILIPTRAYQTAAIGWHAVLFLLVLFTAANVLFIVVLLMPWIINLVLWSLVILMGLFIGTLIMTIFFRILVR